MTNNNNNNNNIPASNLSLTYTTPESLPRLTHTAIAPPTPTQVVVAIKAAAINPVDIQLWGNPVLGWLAGATEKGIGRDYSGEIVAAGSDAARRGWDVGTAVFGLCVRPTAQGSFAKYIAVDVDREPLARKPLLLAHAQAAAVPLVALTAYAVLDWLPSSPSPRARDAAPRRVIVAGASGGVGMWVVQLAKKVYGCYVIGVCSGRNAGFVKGLGADEVVSYDEVGDVKQVLLGKRREGGKFDLYVDCVGGTEVFGYWRELLHTTGAYITIVGDKTSRTAIGGPLTYFTYPSQVMRYVQGYLFGPRYANVILHEKSELLEQAGQLAEKGDVEVLVQDVVKGILHEEGHKEAWEKVKGYMVEGRVRGKIVVEIA
ncbi:hypothetical protein ACN47E_001521 [Coniothyrium glycines]